MHEHTRDAAQRIEGSTDADKALGVAEVVARVDDEVGLEVGERRHPLLLAMLPRRHVGVGDVQHSQCAASGGQNGERVAADGEQVPLDADAPDRGSRADRPHCREGGEGGLAGASRH